MAQDRELTEFRQQHYGLFVALLAREPTADLLAALGNGLPERSAAAHALHPQLGQGWETLGEVLPKLDAETATDEYLRLFIGPMRPEATPYESWYLTGQLFQRPLVDVRGFMGELGLERDEARFPEPEDVLAFELEIMNWLVARQLEAETPEQEAEWLERQARFLRDHLLVWAPACTLDLEKTRSAALYRGVAQLLRGFLAWEQTEFLRRGMRAVETLEEARKRYPQVRRYAGPIADEELLHAAQGKPKPSN